MIWMLVVSSKDEAILFLQMSSYLQIIYDKYLWIARWRTSLCVLCVLVSNDPFKGSITEVKFA